jgi:hypothetical protein
MRTFLLSAAGASLLFSAAAFADDAKPVTPAPTPAKSSDQLICHAVAHEGSVVHRSDCRTQREWDRVRFESQQSLREWQLRNLTLNQ